MEQNALKNQKNKKTGDFTLDHGDDSSDNKEFQILTKYLPKKLDFFERASLDLLHAGTISPHKKGVILGQLERLACLIYQLKGEVTGQVAIIIDEQLEETFPNNEYSCLDFTQEVVSTFLGQYLTQLDHKSSLLVTYDYPFYFPAKDNSTVKENMRKKKIISLLQSIFDTHTLIETQYRVTHSQFSFILTPIFITRILRTSNV